MLTFLTNCRNYQHRLVGKLCGTLVIRGGSLTQLALGAVFLCVALGEHPAPQSLLLGPEAQPGFRQALPPPPSMVPNPSCCLDWLTEWTGGQVKLKWLSEVCFSFCGSMRAEGGRGQERGALGLGQGSGGRSRETVGSQGPPREVLSGRHRVG